MRVVGEISNYKLHTSGHRYFTLKDEGAQIRCVMWRSRNLSFEPRDGMKVYVSGRLSVYPAQGSYQIDCTGMMPAGTGDLYLAFEQLKQQLSEAGYFDAARKKPLPRFPVCVGVATSPTGAAIRDILSTIERRMPATIVHFRPTLVQGEGSAEDIAHAIAELEDSKCDVIIIGRGGGSIEDLWSFNTRLVADAIYNARLPIISAVGHETDFTIADFVADIRAATPTAAAELCTPYRREDLLYTLDQWTDDMQNAVQSRLDIARENILEMMDERIGKRLLQHITNLQRDTTIAEERISQAVQRSLRSTKEKLFSLERHISSLYPLAPLQKGFALLKDGSRIIEATESLEPGQHITIQRALEERIAVID